MKINIYGFEWELGNGISLDEFCNYHKKLSGKEIYNKIIAIDKKDGFWIGFFYNKGYKIVLQNNKRWRKFCNNTRGMEEGDGMADFDFFIIHPETARGLYQHDHQRHYKYLLLFYV